MYSYYIHNVHFVKNESYRLAKLEENVQCIFLHILYVLMYSVYVYKYIQTVLYIRVHFSCAQSAHIFFTV